MDLKGRLALVLLAAILAGLACQPSASPVVGGNAPELGVQTLTGDKLELAKMRGKGVVVNFWATWCAPCRLEMPGIVEMAKKYENEVVVIAMDVQEDASLVKPFAEEFKMTMPIGMDANGDVVNRYRVRGLPTTFFIGKDGKIRYVQVGPMSDDFLEGQIKQLIGS